MTPSATIERPDQFPGEVDGGRDDVAANTAYTTNNAVALMRPTVFLSMMVHSGIQGISYPCVTVLSAPGG